MNTHCYKVLFPNLETEQYHVSTDEHIRIVNDSIEPSNVKSDDQDLYSIVFAPDPLTGLPSSDLSLMVKNKYSEDVRRFIDEKGFQRPVQDFDRLAVDTDLSLVRDRRSQYGTERQEYLRQLRDVAQSGLKKSEVKSDKSD